MNLRFQGANSQETLHNRFRDTILQHRQDVIAAAMKDNKV